MTGRKPSTRLANSQHSRPQLNSQILKAANILCKYRWSLYKFTYVGFIAFITKPDGMKKYVENFFSAKEYSGLKKAYDNYVAQVIPDTPELGQPKSHAPINQSSNKSKSSPRWSGILVQK